MDPYTKFALNFNAIPVDPIAESLPRCPERTIYQKMIESGKRTVRIIFFMVEPDKITSRILVKKTMNTLLGLQRQVNA